MVYLKRHFDEPRIELDENWGTCDYYFEVSEEGEVSRQIEFYSNGITLQYDAQLASDDFGFLTDQPLDLGEYKEFAINKDEFESLWNR